DGLKDSTLIARTLSPVARAFCAAPSYLKKAGIPRTPDDLQDHVCLTYSLSSQHGSWPVSNHGETASVEIEGRYNVNNSLALREALLQGRGVTLTPTFIVGDDIKTGRLKSILTAYTPPPQTLYAVYPQARHVSQKVRVFVDFLAERFRASPYWDD
ncbi:MAG: substrate binding domain-containing protein, partial [Pseudomonadota bacterium]